MEIQAARYGFYMARMSNGLLAEITVGGVGAEIPTYVRYDNSDTSYQVGLVNTVSIEKPPEWLSR